MFPGFITVYKDNNNYIHLYFFPGINDIGKPIYNNLDLSKCEFDFDKKVNYDKSIDYKFLNKKIKKIYCKLVYSDNISEEKKSLTI